MFKVVKFTVCVPHGEDKEKKNYTSQHCHDEPEINLKMNKVKCLHSYAAHCGLYRQSTNIFKKILFLFQKLTLIFRSLPLDSQRKFL